MEELICTFCLEEILPSHSKAVFPTEKRWYHINKGCYHLAEKCAVILKEIPAEKRVLPSRQSIL